MHNDTYHGLSVVLEVIFCPDGVTQKTSFGRLAMSCEQCNVANEPRNTDTGGSLSPVYVPQRKLSKYYK